MDWVEPHAGFELKRQEVIVTRAHQQQKFDAMGLDASIYGDLVDPSFYIGLGIRAGIESGISAEGNVNMLSNITQHRAVSLEEPIYSAGSIVAVEPVPRGLTIQTDVWFEDEAGERAISVPRRSLKPDLSSGSARGAGDRPPPVVTDIGALDWVSEHQLTPEGVKAYSSEGNSIHYEMESANKAGFRAPIIGGGMGVHYLMLWLWQDGVPQHLDIDVFFRRPIFWDDQFQVGVTPDGSGIALVKEGKVLTEARINRTVA